LKAVGAGGAPGCPGKMSFLDFFSRILLFIETLFLVLTFKMLKGRGREGEEEREGRKQASESESEQNQHLEIP